MAVTLIQAPALEPVTLMQAKAHMRVEHDYEDELITSYIMAARQHVEAYLSRVLIAQGWRMNFDHLPVGECLELPISPILSIDAARIYPPKGASVALGRDDYEADTASAIARFCLKRTLDTVRAFQAYEIEATAGYGQTAEDVPAPIRHAILLMVAHWYEYRGYDDRASAAPHGDAPLLGHARKLIDHYRRMTL